MAYIRKRGNKWQAIVRKKGIRPKTRTFQRKADAVSWANGVSALMDSPDYVDIDDENEELCLKDLIIRYRDFETPKKAGCKSETYRINNALREKGSHYSLDKEYI